jgi:long-chain-fatty-acid--CoA ligase ACSBG
LIALDINERKSVNIIGFNSPEWVIAFFGAIFANTIPSGVYTTNTPDACFYVAEHSEAEVVICENNA